MKDTTLILALALFGLSVLLAAASLALQGPLPGDVAVTRWCQQVFGADPAWAVMLTQSAKHPLVWITCLVTALLAYGASRWQGVALVATGFGTAKLLDWLLRAVVHTPKPEPGWVMVATPSAASGFPSTFALVYVALFGALLVGGHAQGRMTLGVRLLAAAMLIAGCLARITLGGHWVSQIAASVALMFVVMIVSQHLLRRIFPPAA